MANSCDSILEHGIFNELHYTTIDAFHADVRRVLSITREQSEETSGSADLSALWDLVHVGGNEDVVKELKEQYALDETIAVNSSAMRTLESRVVSKQIVDAWLACNGPDHERTLNIYATAPKDPHTNFVVNLDYIPVTDPHAPKFDVIDVQVANAQILGGGLRKGASLVAYSGLSLICRRSGPAKVIVLVNLRGAGSLKVELPEIIIVRPLPTLKPAVEVLVNGSGEANDGSEPPAGWTCVVPSGYRWHTNRTGRTNRAIHGSYLMWPGHHPGDYSELQQDIDLSRYAADFIDKNRLLCDFEGWLVLLGDFILLGDFASL